MSAWSNVFPSLSADVKKDLRTMVFGQKTEHRLWFRAHIIWYVIKLGWSVPKTAAFLRTTVKTVEKWCERFCAEGIAGLEDRPRSGRPPVFTVQQRCEVLAVACDEPARYGYFWQATWTLDTLTQAVNTTVSGLRMSRASIWRTLKNGSSPFSLVNRLLVGTSLLDLESEVLKIVEPVSLSLEDLDFVVHALQASGMDRMVSVV